MFSDPSFNLCPKENLRPKITSYTHTLNGQAKVDVDKYYLSMRACLFEVVLRAFGILCTCFFISRVKEVVFGTSKQKDATTVVTIDCELQPQLLGRTIQQALCLPRGLGSPPPLFQALIAILSPSASPNPIQPTLQLSSSPAPPLQLKH